MDAVAVVMIGAGVWVLYSAYKGHDPFSTALGILKSTSSQVTPAQVAASGAAPSSPVLRSS